MTDGATLGKAYIQIIPSMEGTGSKWRRCKGRQ